MENSISRQNVNVNVRAVVTDPNVTVQYKTKVLQKNVVNGVNTLTPAMISEANIKYIIKYDYTLSDDITVPANCVLEFDGGSISGEHTITGTNTGTEAGLIKIFNTDVTIAGTWNVEEAYPEWFGAKGDGVTDDTTSIQKVIDSFIYTKLTKIYKTTSTIIFPQYLYRSVIGTNPVGFGTGNQYEYCGIKSSADVAILINYDSQRFVRVSLENFAIHGESGKSCGLKIRHLSNALIRNISIFNYIDGVGIWWFTETEDIFNAQYSNIEDCIFNCCKEAIKLETVNGFNITHCYLDGNDNFGILETYGFKLDSKAVNLINCDTINVISNQIQGWHYGVYVNSGHCTISSNRFEGTGIGIYINGNLNRVEGNNVFNNHIIATHNNVERFGVTGYILGELNIINNCVFQSMYGIQVNDGNIDNTGQTFFYDLEDLDLNNEIHYLTPRLDDFNERFGCQIDRVELCIQNFNDFVYAWSNFILETNDEIFYSQDATVTDGFYNVVIKNTTHRQWLSQTNNPIILRLQTDKDLDVMKQVRLMFKVKNMVIESDAQYIMNLS